MGRENHLNSKSKQDDFSCPIGRCFACFKEKLTKYVYFFTENKTKYFKSFDLYSKSILIQEFVLDIYTRKQDKNVSEHSF